MSVKTKSLRLPSIYGIGKMFDEAFGKYAGSDYTIEVPENDQPYDAKPCTIPTIHESTQERSSLIRQNKSMKIRELNKTNKRKPFPLPTIQHLLLKLEDFISYLVSQKQCTIVLHYLWQI